MTHMTEYIDKTEAMRRFKPFGREIPKEQVMAVLARIDEEIVRCGECKHRYVDGENVRYNVCELNHNKVQSDEWFCADGERSEE